MSQRKPRESRKKLPEGYADESFQRTHKPRRRKTSEASKEETLASGNQQAADETLDSEGKYGGTTSSLNPASYTDSVSDMAKDSPSPLPIDLEQLEEQVSDPRTTKTDLRSVAQGLLTKLKSLLFLPHGLSSEQRTALEAAYAIIGTDAKARKQVQAALRRLEGQQASEGLATALGRLLRSRGWGIELEGGHAASVTWVRDKLRTTGGRIHLRCLEEGKSISKFLSTIPRLRIVAKPDRRKSDPT